MTKAADDVGMRDYALDENNGTVMTDVRFTSPVYSPPRSMFSTGMLKSVDSFLGTSALGDHVGGADEAINQRNGKGDCFAFGVRAKGIAGGNASPPLPAPPPPPPPPGPSPFQPHRAAPATLRFGSRGESNRQLSPWNTCMRPTG